MNRVNVNRVNTYTSRRHAAVRTEHFVYNQLIPYIGNKRKLLGLIQESLRHTGQTLPATFLDLFAGSGVVSRMAKSLGYRVIANDWEPYARAINSCYIGCNLPPRFEKDAYSPALRPVTYCHSRPSGVGRMAPQQEDLASLRTPKSPSGSSAVTFSVSPTSSRPDNRR